MTKNDNSGDYWLRDVKGRDLIVAGANTTLIGGLAIADMIHPLPVSNGWLAILFVLSCAISFTIKVKIINDVNPHLPPSDRWPYLQYMTVFHSQRLDEQHRRFHPGYAARLLPWITSTATLLIAVEVVRRWIVFR